MTVDHAFSRDLGFIRVHLLHHAAEDRIFGTEMIEELAHHGHELSLGHAIVLRCQHSNVTALTCR